MGILECLTTVSSCNWGSSSFSLAGKGKAHVGLHEEHFYGAGLEMTHTTFHWSLRQSHDHCQTQVGWENKLLLCAQ